MSEVKQSLLIDKTDAFYDSDHLKTRHVTESCWECVQGACLTLVTMFLENYGFIYYIVKLYFVLGTERAWYYFI